MDMNVVDQYSIRQLSEISGVNAVTIRAWERRYGLLK
ncbi:MAG: MerR family DNA-binding transcriptional regulator, partial [Pseudomonadales bacterium]|nr:MerR family DNA-binding transcriptional regulator [Pseudomonadales bacterium]